MFAVPQPIRVLTPPPDPLPRDRRYGPIVSEYVPETVHVTPVDRVVLPETDWWASGKSTRDAWPHMWLFQGWNMESTLHDIQEPNGFQFPTILSAMVIPGSPIQGHRPMPDSVTITPPAPGTWSQQSQINAPISFNSRYAKIV